MREKEFIMVYKKLTEDEINKMNYTVALEALVLWAGKAAVNKEKIRKSREHEISQFNVGLLYEKLLIWG